MKIRYTAKVSTRVKKRTLRLARKLARDVKQKIKTVTKIHRTSDVLEFHCKTSTGENATLMLVKLNSELGYVEYAFPNGS